MPISPEPFQPFQHDGVVRHGLPAEAYRSEAFFRSEQRRLFPSHWVFVGFAHEMSAPGDVRPVSVAEAPVLLVRGEDGEIRGFHNACRHRCLKLVDEACNVRRMIRCPYHAWAYDLEGQLRTAPYFGGLENGVPEGFRLEDNGLAPVACRVWRDWIFVNLDGQAEDFETFIGPVAQRLAQVDFDNLQPVATLDLGAVRTNWKFLMENFIEPYHVQFVHARTTDQPLTDHYAFVDGNCLGSGVKLSEASTSSDKLGVDSSYLTLFPNFVLATYAPDQLGVHLNAPVGADETHQRRVIYTVRKGGLDSAEVEHLRSLWWKVHKEDHAMCERLQEGRASPVAADGGWLSPHWESSVRRFQELVYDAVVRDELPLTTRQAQ